MFISKKHLSRRTVLRGLGASVALPLLDAMVPAHTALAQTAAAPVLRFGTVYMPHGVIIEGWMPKTVGKGFELPIILQPLANPPRAFHVISSLVQRRRECAFRPVRDSSPRARTRRAATSIELNTSIDQVIAQKIGQGTPFPSMELAIEDSSNIFGTCAGDFSAPTWIRSRGARPRSRCRWSSTRASSSSGCSAATARRPKRAARGSIRARASSTPSSRT